MDWSQFSNAQAWAALWLIVPIVAGIFTGLVGVVIGLIEKG